MRLILVIISFVLFSCGSIKKDKTNLKLESSSNEDSNSSSNTNRWINSNDYILEPVDLTKPMFWNNNGKKDTVWNTRVINNTRYIKEEIKEDTNQIKKSNEKLSIDKKNKETDNTFLILGVFSAFFLFIIIVIIIAIYLIIREYKATTKLFENLKWNKN
ncbi:hypothetical protein LXD69_10210 [Flavobacterium sediminilitoris]|uniref:Lipoprotein n=1 Tax=Flavobacterium sediminilitoris TaxID=2024526 RepID=A0ABY4HI68_9FLAO|nr:MULTISPECIES: hypothetical protein [Flavobacterium]UOX32425.1 hypothetical protein LXD69_10210 [Flavobacterium sediminilitoris]